MRRFPVATADGVRTMFRSYQVGALGVVLMMYALNRPFAGIEEGPHEGWFFRYRRDTLESRGQLAENLRIKQTSFWGATQAFAEEAQEFLEARQAGETEDADEEPEEDEEEPQAEEEDDE